MLRVTGLTKIYANAHDGIAGGIRDANFDLKPGTFFTLLGPSGCGKTTTLRCIAGLERPDTGVIAVGSEVLFDSQNGRSVPMNRRNIGMVFQSYAIWPHMTVFENVAFPLTVAQDQRYDRGEIEKLVGRALETVNLGGYQKRPATRLSGGEQQRVALARAIVRQPKLLLLDEPLSNLDAHLREEMRLELKRLQKQTGITTVYVTHDQSEALAMSDTIAVISKGQIVQMAPPKDIYFRPQHPFVARFVGVTNLLEGRVEGSAGSGGEAVISLPSGPKLRGIPTRAASPGQDVVISIRPENIHITTSNGGSGSADGNALTGRVAAVTFLGHATRYDVAIADKTLQVLTNPDIVFDTGAEVSLGFPVSKTVAVPVGAT